MHDCCPRQASVAPEWPEKTARPVAETTTVRDGRVAECLQQESDLLYLGA